MFPWNLKKIIAKKTSVLFSTIMPSKIPEFSIYDSLEPILFIYFSNNEILFINSTQEIAPKQSDECIKCGIHNNEFVFYPANKNSSFFKTDLQIDTYRFIELIIATKLNVVITQIIDEIEYFKQKILDYKTIYLLKLRDMIINVKFNPIDTFELKLNQKLNWELENAIRKKASDFAHNNLIDSFSNLFNQIFPNGIFSSRLPLDSHLINIEMVKRYYNKNNLIDSAFGDIFELNINEKIYQIIYFINSIHLQYTVRKKMFAETLANVVEINILGAQNEVIIYSNNDIKLELKRDMILLKTQEKLRIKSLDFSFVCDDLTHNISHKNLEIKGESKIELNKSEIFTLKHITKDFVQRARIRHNLHLVYEINGQERKVSGSSGYNLRDIL